MTAAWRLISVEVLPEARLRVRFIDGTTGEVHMQGFLQALGTAGTVFEPLRDPGFLAPAAVVSGAVQWPNGADVAPVAKGRRGPARALPPSEVRSGGVKAGVQPRRRATELARRASKRLHRLVDRAGIEPATS